MASDVFAKGLSWSRDTNEGDGSDIFFVPSRVGCGINVAGSLYGSGLEKDTASDGPDGCCGTIADV
jgi:hypothetical protein